MLIEGPDFKMELVKNSLSCYDLELLHVVNAKDPEKRREEFQIEGYGLTFGGCLLKIINYRLDQKKEVYSLKEYLEAFKEEKRDLTEFIDGAKK